MRHPGVAMVSLTGDVATGRDRGRAAAESLKRVHLELGGKAPVLVFDDADVAAVAEGVKIAGYFNSGQDCTAASRVIAGPKVYDDLVAALADAASGSSSATRRRGHRDGPARLGRSSATASPASSSARPATWRR